MFENKYALTSEENIFLAKKTLVESIYSQAKMENINITFPDTKTLIDGVSVSGLSTDDIQKVLNLRNAWRFILEDVTAPITLDYLFSVHSLVTYGELAPSLQNKLRTGAVSIGGSFYQPKIPDKDTTKTAIQDILTRDKTATEIAINYFLFACRSQLFWDGNKRTASLIANKLLIDAGAGVLIITERYLRQFNKLMITYYETADAEKLKLFLYDHCIFGIDFQK